MDNDLIRRNTNLLYRGKEKEREIILMKSRRLESKRRQDSELEAFRLDFSTPYSFPLFDDEFSREICSREKHREGGANARLSRKFTLR